VLPSLRDFRSRKSFVTLVWQKGRQLPNGEKNRRMKKFKHQKTKELSRSTLKEVGAEINGQPCKKRETLAGIWRHQRRIKNRTGKPRQAENKTAVKKSLTQKTAPVTLKTIETVGFKRLLCDYETTKSYERNLMGAPSCVEKKASTLRNASKKIIDIISENTSFKGEMHKRTSRKGSRNREPTRLRKKKIHIG